MLDQTKGQSSPAFNLILANLVRVIERHTSHLSFFPATGIQKHVANEHEGTHEFLNNIELFFYCFIDNTKAAILYLFNWG